MSGRLHPLWSFFAPTGAKKRTHNKDNVPCCRLSWPGCPLGQGQANAQVLFDKERDALHDPQALANRTRDNRPVGRDSRGDCAGGAAGARGAGRWASLRGERERRAGYTTIQAAVDDTTCTRITIAPGVYREQWRSIATSPCWDRGLARRLSMAAEPTPSSC